MNFLNEDGNQAKFKEMLITKGCEAFEGDDERLRKCMSIALKNNLQKYMRFGKIKKYLNNGRNKYFINIIIKKDGDIFTTNQDIHPKIKKEIDRAVAKMEFLNLEVLGDYDRIKFTLPLNIVQKKQGIKAIYDSSYVQINDSIENLDRLPATGFCKYLKEEDDKMTCVEDRVIAFLFNSIEREKLKDIFTEGTNAIEFEFTLDQNTSIQNLQMKFERHQVISSYLKSKIEQINFISPGFSGLRPQDVKFDVKLVFYM
ncbi:MAG: hypothetical protein GVY05_07455 [Bacteroidetes bacterium]|nr:hypothetical protein [Bacteroidota bacterium]